MPRQFAVSRNSELWLLKHFYRQAYFQVIQQLNWKNLRKQKHFWVEHDPRSELKFDDFRKRRYPSKREMHNTDAGIFNAWPMSEEKELPVCTTPSALCAFVS